MHGGLWLQLVDLLDCIRFRVLWQVACGMMLVGWGLLPGFAGSQPDALVVTALAPAVRRRHTVGRERVRGVP
jgi:hypothetical protein